VVSGVPPPGANRRTIYKHLGRFPFNKKNRFKFSEFSLVEWKASDRLPEFDVTCSATQGMLGETVVFEYGGLSENFHGFRAA